MNMILIWLVLAAVFLVVELITVGMVSLWFMIGALAAALAAALGAALWLQIVIFLLISALCFAFLYPKLKHLIVRSNQPTNADVLLGKTCLVVRRIDNVAGTGAVTVDGKTWTARTLNGETVEEGALVRAAEIQGVKLIVTPLTHSTTN